MGVIEVAGGIFSRLNIGGVIFHFFNSFAMHKTFALLGYNGVYNASFGIEIIGHFFGFKLLLPLLKFGLTMHHTSRICHPFGKNSSTFHVNFHIVRFQFQIIVQNFSLIVKSGNFIFQIEMN